jgi:GNAT superfamily N-acetyltransferase
MFPIRSATPADFPAILSLIKELALFEKAADQVTNTVERMEAEQDLFSCFVVENEQGEVIAMALYYRVYYTWVGKSLYLDDLYVQQSYRSQGIGTQLLNKLFEVAQAERCQRVRWQVLDWNEPAIALYKKAGATLDGTWCNCDFDTTGIANFKLE